jgi:hypothetical protein
MKTPREILLARHQAAQPRLDALRRELVAEMKPPVSARLNIVALGAELFRLPRPALVGLGLVWGVIVLLNVVAPETSSPAPAPATMARLPDATREELRAQRRLFSELVGTAAEPPRFVPRPRGEAKPAYHYV